MVTVRGPRIIRGTSCFVGVAGGVVGGVVGGVGPRSVAGWSLASIDATPGSSWIAPLTGSPSTTEKVSMNSAAVSSTTVTVIDFVFLPGANVSVPTRAV